MKREEKVYTKKEVIQLCSDAFNAGKNSVTVTTEKNTMGANFYTTINQNTTPDKWINENIMKREEIIERLIKVVYNLPVVSNNDEITLKTNIYNDLGFDELDFVELILDIEKEFSINIPDHILEKIEIIEQFVNLVERELESPSPLPSYFINDLNKSITIES
jgi:acyl carrier protein